MFNDVGTTTIKNLKKGSYFTFKDVDFPSESQVWIRDEYDRESRKYLVYCFGDVNKSRLVSGDKIIFTNFIF